MKILVVAPIVAAEDSFLFKEVTDTYKSLAKEGVEIDVAFLKSGPSCIMNAEQELEALPDIIRIVKEKNDKYEAIILDCMGDPGIGVAREVSNTLIVGPLQSSMAFASTLGYKVSIVTVTSSVLPMMVERITVYGYLNKLASIRYIDMPVLELHDKDKMIQKLIECSQQAINQDGANVIILGCTGNGYFFIKFVAMIGVAAELQEKLKVPVIDPTLCALRFAESLVSMNLRHSKLINFYKP